MILKILFFVFQKEIVIKINFTTITKLFITVKNFPSNTYYIEMVFFMLASDQGWGRVFHFSYWDLFSLDKPKVSPKSSKHEKPSPPALSLKLEAKLIQLGT